MQTDLTPNISTPLNDLELAFDPQADLAPRYKQTCSSSLINNGIVPALRETLVLLALDETVSSGAEAQARLQQYCKEIGAKALEASLKREWDYFDVMVSQRAHLAPLCLALEVSAQADIATTVARTRIPDAYLAEVAAAIPSCEGPFNTLRDLFQNRAVRELVKGAFLEMHKKNPNLDVVHRLITDARDGGHDLTLSPKQQAGLMCLPYFTRTAVQHLLVACSDRTHFAKTLDASERGSPQARALDTLLATYAVANHHWNTLIECFTPSEDTVAAIARDAIDKAHAFRQAQELLQSDTGRSLVTRFFDFRQSRREELKGHLQELPSFQWWQAIDIGHFSAADYLHGLRDASEQDEARTMRATKCGEFAAVLEDDPHQRALYVTLVEQCSKFSLLPENGSACATPHEVLALSKDPRVTYFILDIEIGEHRHAGIDTGIALLEDYFHSHETAEHNDRPLHIVLWSMSTERVKEATRAIDHLLEERAWGNRVNTNSFSSGRNRVSVETKLKTESPLGRV